MNLKNIVKKIALGFAACSLSLALLSPFLRKHGKEAPPSRIVFIARDTTHFFTQETITTKIPHTETASIRKRSYTPYAEIVKKRATLIEQLTELYKNEPVHECSSQTKGIVHRVSLPPCDSCKTLFLTLDACIAGFDSTLIKYLILNKIHSTIFITTRWINNHPQVMQQLCQHLDIFEVENHGTLHRLASVNGCTRYGVHGTENMTELVAEVEVGADIIERLTGVQPAFFRSGTAFADNVAVAAIGDMGYRFIGFSVAADEGATLPRHAVKQRILTAQHGDIILMHFNSKNSETHLGFMMALEEMRQKKVCVRFEKLRDFADKLEAY